MIRRDKCCRSFTVASKFYFLLKVSTQLFYGRQLWHLRETKQGTHLKKYSQNTTRHHGVLSIQLRRYSTCKKKVLVKIWRKTSLQLRICNSTKKCTLDNLEVIISVVVKKTLYKSDLPFILKDFLVLEKFIDLDNAYGV